MRVMEIIREAEGGMKTHFISLVKGLAAQGIEVIVLCNFERKSRILMESDGVQIIPCPFPGTIKLLTDFRTIVQIASIIRDTRPNIVHCHGFKAGLLGRSACLLTGSPMLYTVHNFITYGRDKYTSWLIRNIERWMGNKTDAIISVSHALKKSMNKDNGIDNEKIHVIYNSIPQWSPGDRNATRRKHNIEDNHILIGTVARLIPSKGIDVLLKAVAGIVTSNSCIKLLIAGSGPEETRLKELSQKLGMESQVIFTGRISDMHNYYSAFDIFILPTLTEGLGITVMEAMYFGLPVIASSVGGIPELVKDRINGLLVQADNIFELRTAIQFLLDNPLKATQYGKQAKEDIEKGLTQNDMINETISVLEKYI